MQKMGFDTVTAKGLGSQQPQTDHLTDTSQQMKNQRPHWPTTAAHQKRNIILMVRNMLGNACAASVLGIESSEGFYA